MSHEDELRAEIAQLRTAMVESEGRRGLTVDADGEDSSPDAPAGGLAVLDAVLARASSSDELLDVAFERALAVTGAVAGAIAMATGRGTLAFERQRGFDEKAALWRHLPLETDSPPSRAFRDATAVICEDRESFVERYPHLTPDSPSHEGRAALPLRGSQGTAIGVLYLAFDGPLSGDDPLLERLEELAVRYGRALERMLLLETAQWSARRMRAVQRVTAELGAAVSADEIANITSAGARDAVNAHAGGVALYVDGALRAFAVEGYPEEFRSDPSAPIRDDFGVIEEVMRSGQIVSFGSKREMIARFPERADRIERSPYHATALIAIPGRSAPLGVLNVTRTEPRAFDEADLDTLVTVARQAGLALERAHHLADLELALVRERALHDVANGLASGRTVQQMAESVLAGAELFGASMAYVGTVDADRTRVSMVASHGFDEVEIRAYREIPLDAKTLVSEAIRTRAAIVIGSREEMAVRFPTRVDAMERLEIHASAVQPVVIAEEVVACIALSYTAAHSLTEEERGLLDTLGRLFGHALERARAHESETTARAALERAMSRLGRLQGVTAALTPQLRTDEIAYTIVREATVALGADSTGLFVPRGPSLEALARSGDDGDTGWDGAEHVSQDSPLAIAESFRTRRPVWVPSKDEWRRRYPSAPADYHRGAGAVLAVPLVVEDELLGVLGLLFRRERALAKDERRLAATIGHQAAQALERARLYDSERRVAERTTRLQEVAGALAAAATPREVAEVLIGAGVRAIGARAGAVGIVDPDGHGLQIVGRTSVPGDPMDVVDLASSADPWPGLDAMSERRPVLIGSERDLAERYPGLVSRASEDARAGEGGSWATLPLLTDAGAIGFVHFSFEGRRRFGDEQLRELRTMTAQASQAMDRARLFAMEHEVARVLQGSLLPGDQIESEAFAVSTRYQAGADHMEVGGDWFEVVALGGERLGVAVGDVVGRGLQAAAAMGQLRSALRALAIAGGGPAAIIDGLERFAERTPGAAMSTVVYGELDPSSGDFTFCAAGHPPPLLETDGAVEVLETGRSPLLAVGATGPRPTATVRLQPGATLVLYTDGLVERRGETFDLGIRRLERALRATVDLDPEARCEAILERLLDGIEQDDDVALLCVRRSGATRGRFSSRVRPEPSELGGLRHRIGSWLREHHLEEEEVASVVLAVNEAVANAIEHGGRGSVDVLVDATMDEGALTIEIRDQGRWQNRPSEPDRGRGLLLMQALMDEVDVERSSSGTLVRMRWGSADGPDDRYGVAHRGRG